MLVPERRRILVELTASMPADPTHRARLAEETAAHLDQHNPNLNWVAVARQRLDDERRAVATAEADRRAWINTHRGDGQRLAGLTAAIAHREAVLTRAALADPSPGLLALIGPPPDDRVTRTAWAQAARAVTAWEDLTGRALPTNPPSEPELGGWWHTARRAISHPGLARHLDNHHITHHLHPQKGLER